MVVKSAAKNLLFTKVTKLPIDAHYTDLRGKTISPVEHTESARKKRLSSIANLELNSRASVCQLCSL